MSGGNERRIPGTKKERFVPGGTIVNEAIKSKIAFNKIKFSEKLEKRTFNKNNFIWIPILGQF